MTSIPASALVNVQPSVIDAGSSLLSLSGLFLTDNPYMPSAQILDFATAAQVQSYFGRDSTEYVAAQVYFAGYTGSVSKPSILRFAAYIAPYDPELGGGSSAFVRGASIRGTTLADMQEITAGSFTITINGVAETSAVIDLSGAGSFSDVADIINVALSTGSVVSYSADLQCFFVTSEVAGATSTITVPTGTVATALRLTSIFPVAVSQGSDGATLLETMESIVLQTQAFSTFSTIFEPDADGKDALAEWTDGQNYGYAYIAWDTDSNALIAGADCFGLRLFDNELSGTSPVYASSESDGLALAAFVMGVAASVDYGQQNGRITFAFRGQDGLVASINNKPDADALINNGYNFYGDYATKNQQFKLFQTGSIAGEWKWLDTFLNQIYMNSRIQQALLQLLASVNSLPYNTDGYGMLRVTIQQPAAEFINFGSIREGISLDAEQASIVNQQAGVKIDDILSTAGWYLQILPATSQARSNRTTPPMKFWYTDGGSIQQISLDSINVL